MVKSWISEVLLHLLLRRSHCAGNSPVRNSVGNLESFRKHLHREAFNNTKLKYTFVCLFSLCFVQQLLILKYAWLDEFLFFSGFQALSFCFCNEDVTIYDITLISMATACKVNNILHLHCRTSSEEDGSCWNMDMGKNSRSEHRGCLGRGILL